MATHDDDFLTSPVPEPDAEATPSERAHAKTFADIVDKSLVGRTPVAMSADDRALLARGRLPSPAATPESAAAGGLGMGAVDGLARRQQRDRKSVV